VVEKSREIYESMMYEEAAEEDDEEETVEEGLSINVEETTEDQVGGLMSEIGAEEEGMMEEDDEFADIEVDDSEEEMPVDGEEGEAMSADDKVESLEDEVLDMRDDLDRLMAEFEEKLGSMDSKEGEEEVASDEMASDADMAATDDEEAMMEAVQLQKVAVTHGDNGQNTKSPVSGGPKVSGNGAKAVNAFGGDEKGGKAPAPKTIPGTYKNAPGQKGQDLAAAPKPKHGDDGQNTKSPLGESKKSKKIVK
jgi:hypothetical protein